MRRFKSLALLAAIATPLWTAPLWVAPVRADPLHATPLAAAPSATKPATTSLPDNISEFSEPWKRADLALVIDAYEYNPIDWAEMTADKRIVGFINKASDGLPPAYYCSGDETAVRLCKALWKRHAVAQELFQTRRALAKALGLKWGAYHLARPGNPLAQADNFLQFAQPGPDDLMALDIEENDPQNWMSLPDAEVFVAEIRRRTGRYPILYTNGSTAKHIADRRDDFPLLSKLPLWYARYKPEIGIHFPKGNWQSYTLWQFSAQANCNARSCPYRVKGTNFDIDVNVASMTADALRAAWPFGGLLGTPPDLLTTVPVPVARAEALAGKADITYASVRIEPGSLLARAYAFLQAGERYPERGALLTQKTEPAELTRPLHPSPALLAYAAEPPAGHVAALDAFAEPQAFRDLPKAALDKMITAAVSAAPPGAPSPPQRPLFYRYDFPVLLLGPAKRRKDTPATALGLDTEPARAPYRTERVEPVFEDSASQLLAASFREPV